MLIAFIIYMFVVMPLLFVGICAIEFKRMEKKQNERRVF